MVSSRQRRVALGLTAIAAAAAGGYGVASATAAPATTATPATPTCPAPSVTTVPCVIFGHKNTFVSVQSGGFHRVGAMTVPAGKYAITAKLTLSNSGSNPASVGCILTAGTQVDQSDDLVASSDPTGTADSTVVLTGTHAFSSSGTIAISCNDFSATNTISAHFIHSTAERVGALADEVMS